MINPNVHLIKLKGGGVKLVYVSNPSEDIDRVVRRAFKIPLTPVFTPLDNIPQNLPFVLDGPSARVYSSHLTPFAYTYYEAIVGKNQKGLVLPVYVGIASNQKFAGIEDIINLRILEGEFFVAGLVPFASKLEDIPKYFLKGAL
jgi:hypothetical protein